MQLIVWKLILVCKVCWSKSCNHLNLVTVLTWLVPIMKQYISSFYFLWRSRKTVEPTKCWKWFNFVQFLFWFLLVFSCSGNGYHSKVIIMKLHFPNIRKTFLTHFMSMVSFYTSWKPKKKLLFFMFSKGMEKEQWHEIC